MSNARDQLRTGIEGDETWSRWAAWVIVAGLVIEAVLALTFPSGKTVVENWGPIAADIMIALGVYGEIHFSGRAARKQKELQSISDQELANAIQIAAQASEKAARLENDAAQARAEQERLKAQLAWRAIAPESASKLKSILSGHPGGINVQHIANDPEALYLAIQIANIFGNAKWQVGMLSVTMGGVVIFGTFIPDTQSPDTAFVRAAFRGADLGFTTDPLPQRQTMAVGGTVKDAPIIFIGSKPIQR